MSDTKSFTPGYVIKKVVNLTSVVFSVRDYTDEKAFTDVKSVTCDFSEMSEECHNYAMGFGFRRKMENFYANEKGGVLAKFALVEKGLQAMIDSGHWRSKAEREEAFKESAIREALADAGMGEAEIDERIEKMKAAKA